MDRRNFIRLSAVSITGVATSKAAAVETTSTTLPCETNKMAGGLYYTSESPGRWAKKVGGHIPNIIQIKKNNETSVKIITWHEMRYNQHYIVKHVILDQDYRFLAEYVFVPGKDKAAKSKFNLKNYHGRIYVLSVCNTHDTWLNYTDI